MSSSFVTFWIPGQPVPWPRAEISGGKFPLREVEDVVRRLGRNPYEAAAEIRDILQGKKLHMFMPVRQRRHAEYVQSVFLDTVCTHRIAADLPWKGRVDLHSTFVFLQEDSPQDFRSEDADNLNKLVMDALQGYAWHNDRQVSDQKGRRRLSTTETGTVIRLRFFTDRHDPWQVVLHGG